MENSYQKSFPQLMEGKRIVYVHGFGSAGSTHTAEMLRQLMPHATVISPDLPIHPEEAMELLRTLVEREQPHLVIGTSMGGMYTEMLTGYDRICVNPAMQMGDTMLQHGMVGLQTFQNPRQDGVQEFMVTKALVKEYKAITEQCFAHAGEDMEQQRVFGLFGDNDTTVDTYDLFRAHYPNAIHFHGEHRLNDKVLLHYVIPVIRWIDDRQNQTVRKTVLIDYDIMHDSYMNPVSSLRKTFYQLIEDYDVYIVDQAPTALPHAMADTALWVEQHLSTPAWNRTVFTNQPEMIGADYYVIRADSPQALQRKERIDGLFFGTLLPFGTDNMKTFEDVAGFFSQLGGQ